MTAKITTVPGQRDAFAALLLDGTHAMPGCLSYVVARDPADENALWITEVWDSQESHKASLSLPVGPGRDREGPSTDRRLQQSSRDRPCRWARNPGDTAAMNRREALAALASAAALPFTYGCSREPAASVTPTTTEADALAMLDQIADNLLRLATGGCDVAWHRHRRDEPRCDRSSPIGPRRDSSRLRISFAPTWRRINAFEHVRPSPRDAHERRGGPQRIRHLARGIRAPLRRCRRRRLAQHAVRRHPERRRVSRHPALPRRRASHRERR